MKLYLRGDKDFCSIAVDGKLGLIGLTKVPANDARSVAVPIVPKRIGEIEIEVTSILQVKVDNQGYMNTAGDAVKRKIFVVVGLNKDQIVGSQMHLPNRSKCTQTFWPIRK